MRALEQPEKSIRTLKEAREEIARLRSRLQRHQQPAGAGAGREERLRLYNDLLLENYPGMVFLFNEEQRFVLCSQACLPLLSAPGGAALEGAPFAEVFSPAVDRAFVEKLAGQSAQAQQACATFRYDDTIHFEGGAYMHVQVSLSPIVDGAGGCRGSILSIGDITELEETRRAAEAAARSKSGFLANMSHEIRTPMNAIKGLSELLSLTELDSLQRNYVGNIVSSSDSLLSIINDVLDFSKIDVGRVELMEGPYSVAELLAEVTGAAGLRSEGKGLSLMVEADPATPAELWGDDVRVKQVLLNLLTNAVKYTPAGHVRLRLHTEPWQDRVRLCCKVEDSGIGIKPEDVPTLFEAFARADLHTNRSIAGTGLGLAIAKQLVQAMGGDITVESTYGEGSTFAFWVPQKVVDAAPLARVDRPGALNVLLLGGSLQMESVGAGLEALGVAHRLVPDAEGPIEAEEYTHALYEATTPAEAVRRLHQQSGGLRFAVLRDMRDALEVDDGRDTVLFTPLLVTDLALFLNRAPGDDDTVQLGGLGLPGDFTVRDTLLLVVDDNEVNLLVGGEMLRAFGAEVDCAAGGEEALALCDARRYDIIFMDHMMPGMDGVQATAAIRAGQGPNQQTPIIALTANVVNNMQSYYVRQGMDDFVGKPVEFDDMARVLVRWLPAGRVVHGG